VRPPADSSSARALDPEVDLHVCGTCRSPLVHPLAWEPVGPRYWRIELRCPECGWEGTGVFDRSVADRLEDELDRAAAQLVADLLALTRANMEDFAARFAAALEADLVLPEDF
jgi:hypothetical protein